MRGDHALRVMAGVVTTEAVMAVASVMMAACRVGVMMRMMNGWRARRGCVAWLSGDRGGHETAGHGQDAEQDRKFADVHTDSITIKPNTALGEMIRGARVIHGYSFILGEFCRLEKAEI